jgi:nitrite reductase/ring-hydroxylating ferredoxin subunit
VVIFGGATSTIYGENVEVDWETMLPTFVTASVTAPDLATLIPSGTFGKVAVPVKVYWAGQSTNFASDSAKLTTYSATSPLVSKLSPTEGYSEGGTAITITVENFANLGVVPTSRLDVSASCVDSAGAAVLAAVEEDQTSLRSVAQLLLAAKSAAAFNPVGSSISSVRQGALHTQKRLVGPGMVAGTDPTKIPRKNVWVPFANADDVKPGSVVSGFQYGQEVAIACTKGGKFYGLSNKLPPTGQPATLGDLKGDTIVEPLSGTVYDLNTGKVKNWCPSLIGSLLLKRIIPQEDVETFKVRKSGKTVSVLINVNAKKQFEATYWRGVLDAQGKVDGGYY